MLSRLLIVVIFSFSNSLSPSLFLSLTLCVYVCVCKYGPYQCVFPLCCAVCAELKLTSHETKNRGSVFAVLLCSHLACYNCLWIVAIHHFLIFGGTYRLGSVFSISFSMSFIIQTQNRWRFFISSCFIGMSMRIRKRNVALMCSCCYSSQNIGLLKYKNRPSTYESLRMITTYKIVNAQETTFAYQLSMKMEHFCVATIFSSCYYSWRFIYSFQMREQEKRREKWERWIDR